MAKRRAHLRVLLWEEPPLKKTNKGLVKDLEARPIWVAACLDHFVVEQGQDLLHAWTNLRQSLAAELEKEPSLRPAPKKYQDLWGRGLSIGSPPHAEPVMPDAEARLVPQFGPVAG